ncbi:hypothetical protein B0H10DRAFT_2063367 [Mycena sp. CBHHK59/15]|nr:hypothetical protein B0H10DRAFT_2063367 [Mycena sp. CBHHK59/15]
MLSSVPPSKVVRMRIRLVVLLIHFSLEVVSSRVSAMAGLSLARIGSRLYSYFLLNTQLGPLGACDPPHWDLRHSGLREDLDNEEHLAGWPWTCDSSGPGEAYTGLVVHAQTESAPRPLSASPFFQVQVSCDGQIARLWFWRRCAV